VSLLSLPFFRLYALLSFGVRASMQFHEAMYQQQQQQQQQQQYLQQAPYFGHTQLPPLFFPPLPAGFAVPPPPPPPDPIHLFLVQRVHMAEQEVRVYQQSMMDSEASHAQAIARLEGELVRMHAIQATTADNHRTQIQALENAHTQDIEKHHLMAASDLTQCRHERETIHSDLVICQQKLQQTEARLVQVEKNFAQTEAKLVQTHVTLADSRKQLESTAANLRDKNATLCEMHAKLDRIESRAMHNLSKALATSQKQQLVVVEKTAQLQTECDVSLAALMTRDARIAELEKVIAVHQMDAGKHAKIMRISHDACKRSNDELADAHKRLKFMVGSIAHLANSLVETIRAWDQKLTYYRVIMEERCHNTSKQVHACDYTSDTFTTIKDKEIDRLKQHLATHTRVHLARHKLVFEFAILVLRHFVLRVLNDKDTALCKRIQYTISTIQTDILDAAAAAAAAETETGTEKADGSINCYSYNTWPVADDDDIHAINKTFAIIASAQSIASGTAIINPTTVANAVAAANAYACVSTK
jgi:DNA repair exonuclease SbcCD ATPase subunit